MLEQFIQDEMGYWAHKGVKDHSLVSTKPKSSFGIKRKNRKLEVSRKPSNKGNEKQLSLF